MKLYLIRHAETTDNLSRLYAGSRDSPLTLHGVTQTRHLAHHFSSTRPPLTHIFSSPLTRALKTALALRDVQHQHQHRHMVDVVVVPELKERDFGAGEGRPFGSSGVAGGGGEDREAVGRRAEGFLDGYLIPLLQSEGDWEVAVVSHGILLSHLWRRLLRHLSREGVAFGPSVTAMVGAGGKVELEHLGTWSNTGFLELLLSKDCAADGKKHCPLPTSPAGEINFSTTTSPTTALPLRAVDKKDVTLAEAHPQTQLHDTANPDSSSRLLLHGWTATILAIDSKLHLAGLKRQRGGIGRLAHDERQKKLDMFFPNKRHKAD